MQTAVQRATESPSKGKEEVLGSKAWALTYQCLSHVTRPAGGVLPKHVVLFKAVLGKMPAKRGSKLQDQWVHHAFFGSLTHSGESSKNQA